MSLNHKYKIGTEIKGHNWTGVITSYYNEDYFVLWSYEKKPQVQSKGYIEDHCTRSMRYKNQEVIKKFLGVEDEI